MNLISILEKSIKIGVAIGALIAFASILAISYMTIEGSTAIVLYIVWYSSLLTGSAMIVLSYYTLITIHKKISNDENNVAIPTNEGNMQQNPISELLPSNESLIYDIILEHNGEVRQSAIINESKMSKAKVSRILYSLEKKGLIIKMRSGMGNVIKIVRKK